MNDKRQTIDDRRQDSPVSIQFSKLLEIVKQLRHPSDGCPWDREQTLDSIQKFIVEEAEETKAAMEKGDLENLQEELGDVLFNVLLQAQIASEAGKFSFVDVLTKINKKLTDRHPHVFAGAPMPESAEAAIEQWNILKKAQKKSAAKG